MDRQGETHASLRRDKIRYSSLYEVTDTKIDLTFSRPTFEGGGGWDGIVVGVIVIRLS